MGYVTKCITEERLSSVKYYNLSPYMLACSAYVVLDQAQCAGITTPSEVGVETNVY